MTIIEKTIHDRTLKIYPAEGEDLPLICLNDAADSGPDILARCRQEGCGPFHLVTIHGFDWEEDMTPWPAGDIVSDDDHFDGQARDHLAWMLEAARPWVEKTLGYQISEAYLAGFSLAGLFALWALYQTDAFAGAICVSGSLWYPGFKNYAMARQIKRTPTKVYLSIGGKESQVDHPEFQKSQAIFKELTDYYKAHDAICPVFHLNPGGHFKDTEDRLVKGIHWILNDASCDLAPENA